MLAEIKVGPPVITINQGNTFMVTTETGEILPKEELGFFSQDTRLISSYRFSIEGSSWGLSTAAAVSYYGARYYFVCPKIRTHHSTIDPRELELRLERSVGGGVHEDFDVTNYSNRELSFHFELALESDFADIFEVKEHDITQCGEIDTAWNQDTNELVSTYKKEGFERGHVLQLSRFHGKPHFGNGKIYFRITLPPGGTWHTCCYLIPVISGERHQPQYKCYSAVDGDTQMDRLQKQWRESCTLIQAADVDLQKSYDQAVSDMGALRLYEHDISDSTWMPAAGVPWFVTVFGRDSLLVSLQNMIVSCPFANGTLKRLAALQAKERDDYRDAQPGKILHEIRYGELAHFKLIPHTPYFGSADATILFLTLISETFRWTGDQTILREYRANALWALEWIDRYGDMDNDGFQEYKTFSTKGYHNMGWKDAGDAVVYPDGSQVDQPIAICELQGYVYDAKLRMAEVFDVLGEAQTANQLRSAADQLKQRFNDVYWMEDEGSYGYALDPQKKLVRTIASNPGHLLWSGIVDSREKSTRLVHRLLQPDMFSGWGIRTLSKNNPAYNPHEYQRGSVWPHDNALIAAGAKRYGLWKEANQIARAVFDAAASFAGYRLPELFAGLERLPGGFPVQYPGANIPQAWAAGSVFMLLQTILGLAADVSRNTLYIDPTLPEWLPEITLKNLQVGNHRVSLRFSGTGERSSYEVLKNEGHVQIQPPLARAA